MRIAALKETAPDETRVAVTPETVRKFGALGATVAVESGAGIAAAIPDEAYREAGALIGTAAETMAGANIVLGVQAPDPAGLRGLAPGAMVAAMFDPFRRRDRVEGDENQTREQPLHRETPRGAGPPAAAARDLIVPEKREKSPRAV